MSEIKTLNVINGQINTSMFGSYLVGFVDTQGRFSSTSGTSGDRFILKGKLDAEKGFGKGRLTYALAELGSQGCSSKVLFDKVK